LPAFPGLHVTLEDNRTGQMPIKLKQPHHPRLDSGAGHAVGFTHR